ncbi:MAG: hypothetical protein DME96_13500 [Verrucomicrobia bacterium]|nr:MAG: hypothetical protein DME96_13500 [Verrucomicrobiota bacterium]
MIVIQDAGNVGIFIVAHAEDRRCGELTGVFVEGVAVFDRRFRAIVTVPHLKVHDASHRVCTISGGRTVWQNFDALDRSLRD